MFELLLIACVGVRHCEYLVSPIAYPTEARCAHNAALIAGTVRGRYASTWSHSYRFSCRPQGGDAPWVVVELPVEVEEVPGRVTALDRARERP